MAVRQSPAQAVVRLLITGVRGQLGSELAGASARRGHQAIGVDLPDWDIGDQRQVETALAGHRPDAVLNCAAWTGVDAAESQESAAERVNAGGPALLAIACARRSIRLVHLSTDFVFSGEAGVPLAEDAVPGPLSVYGRTKLAGEIAVRNHCPSHLVVRTSWLYGARGPNFVLTMLRKGRGGERVRVVDDQVGSPTWTGHLAPALLRLLEAGRRGTYHLTNGGQVSWWGFARAIFDEAGLGVPVEPVRTSDLDAAARRPAYSVLDNCAWRRDGELPLPPWREGLRGYLAELCGQAAPADR